MRCRKLEHSFTPAAVAGQVQLSPSCPTLGWVFIVTLCVITEEHAVFSHFDQKYLWKKYSQERISYFCGHFPFLKLILLLPAKNPQMFCWNAFSHLVICLEIPLKWSNPAAICYKRHKVVKALKDSWQAAGDCRMGVLEIWECSPGSVHVHCSAWRSPPWEIHAEVTVSHTAAVNIAFPAIMVNMKRLGESQ